MSGAFSFDPDAFVSRESTEAVEQLFQMPTAWSHGLKLLRERHRPAHADEARWEQVLADATKLATIWGERVLAAGWSVENLFGFDPAEWRTGLAFELRGRRMLAICDRYATIIDPPGWARHHPRMPTGSPLLWTFNERHLAP